MTVMKGDEVGWDNFIWKRFLGYADPVEFNPFLGRKSFVLKCV